MRIRVESAYSDGHESVREEDVPEFTGDPDAEDEFGENALEVHLHPYTGDGHGAGPDGHKLGFCYEITILDAANPALVGRSVEWAGS